MSIATRINSIEEHIENAYDKIDDLGIDLTDVDKNIDNIATVLEEYYDDQPKVTGEGTEVTLEGTRVAKIGIDIKGNSVQETGLLPKEYAQVDYIESTGTQYIDTGYTPVQGDDFEFKNVKINGNGAFFSAGTGDYAFTLVYQSPTYYYKYFSTGGAQSFTISVPVTNIKVTNGGLYFNDVLKKTINYGGEVNTPLYIFIRATLADNIKAQTGEIIITNNGTVKHHYVPCIRKSDNVIGMYDIVSNIFLTNAGIGTFSYGNLPTPNYPVPINSAGDNVNSFDYENAIVKTGYAKDANGNEISTGSGNYTTSFTEVLPNTTYTLSADLTSAVIRFYFYDTNKNWISRSDGYTVSSSNNAYMFTTPNNCYYIQFQNVKNYARNDKAKLEKGSIATPYTPYGMHFITEKIINGNYLENNVANQTINGLTVVKNENKSITLNGTTTASFTLTLNPASSPFLLKAGTYRFCLLGRVQSANNLEVYDINNTRIAVIQGSTVYQSTMVTFEEDVVVGRIITYFNTGKTFNNVILYPMITKGSTAPTVDDYVPHKEQNFIIPCQQPMRKIDIYTNNIIRDFFFKNVQGSEYYDSTLTENAWYEKHVIGHHVFTAQDGWATATSVVEGTTRFYTDMSKVKNQNGAAAYPVISNRFKAISWAQMYSLDTTTKNAISNYNQYNTSQGKIVIRIESTYASTISELRTFFTNNYTYADYELKDEYQINLPCTAEQTTALEALAKAKSYEDTTIIYSEDITPAYLNAEALKGA